MAKDGKSIHAESHEHEGKLFTLIRLDVPKVYALYVCDNIQAITSGHKGARLTAVSVPLFTLILRVLLMTLDDLSTYLSQIWAWPINGAPGPQCCTFWQTCVTQTAVIHFGCVTWMAADNIQNIPPTGWPERCFSQAGRANSSGQQSLEEGGYPPQLWWRPTGQWWHHPISARSLRHCIILLSQHPSNTVLQHHAVWHTWRWEKCFSAKKYGQVTVH